MFSIGEFARLGAVSIRTLRHYPMVYQDLVTWLQAHGFQPHWPGRRDIWIHEVDDISEVDQQVFEAQLAFTRPAADPAEERP